MKSLALVTALLILAPSAAHTQQVDAGAPATTRAGVYTAAQAERGRITYAGRCQSCHSAASHAGVAFEKKWKGRSVADLFMFASTEMPKNDPGSLDPNEYADVIAYLLKVNTMPVGKQELPADSASLAKVLIEIPPKVVKKAVPVKKAPKKP
ncbi:MAG: cytochrome c [Gemmatimonadota bacterium]